MTENKHFCKDCKHHRGIGFDFWCGEGHTAYEVFGRETNCPYYEYHDWSKGIPSEIEDKRFTLAHENDKWWAVRDGDITLWKEEVIHLLNEFDNETQQLQKENKELKTLVSFYKSFQNDARKLEKENRQLKQKISDSGTACAEEITKIEEEFDKEVSRLIKENNKLKSKFSVQLDSLKAENQHMKTVLKENKDLKKLLDLITEAYSVIKDESVKEILRDEIKGIDTVTDVSARAWNDYCILSTFFKEKYGEDWDND